MRPSAPFAGCLDAMVVGTFLCTPLVSLMPQMTRGVVPGHANGWHRPGRARGVRARRQAAPTRLTPGEHTSALRAVTTCGSRLGGGGPRRCTPRRPHAVAGPRPRPLLARASRRDDTRRVSLTRRASGPQEPLPGRAASDSAPDPAPPPAHLTTQAPSARLRRRRRCARRRASAALRAATSGGYRASTR